MKTLLAWSPTSSTPLFCSYDLQAGRDLLWHGASVIFTPSSMVPPRCLSLFDKPGVLGLLRTYCNPDFHGPSHYKMYCILCLFVCFTYLSRIFPYKSRRHHYRWKTANFNLCPALIAIEQRAFSSLPHLLWHAASVYYCRVWGPLTLASVAERLAVELSLPVLTTLVCRDRVSNPDLPHARRTLYHWANVVVPQNVL